ncbi:MAG: 3-oxoacyl-[acyl-carrier protein] reductase [Parcubacteria group bacterium Gr01-1014_66]|nr:MAG: 3-oxoacyl-[acyl-carrier protein] reductase [Parcubacteria group bacterium Gr01-1014_66]
MQLTLAEKIALVTGASRGIGAASVQMLAYAGAHVIVHYRSHKEEAEKTVEKIIHNRGSATLLRGDVSQEKDVEAMLDTISQQFGRLDILVNNAGIMKPNLLLMASANEFDETFATNVRGTFLCARAVLKLMCRQKSGKIINLSSIAGVEGGRGQSVYAASKAAIIGFTKSIAKEAGVFGVTANVVAPGFIETDMTRVLSEKVRVDVLSKIALGRLGTPEDVAKVILFLASPLADYINGQVIGVDGCQIL